MARVYVTQETSHDFRQAEEFGNIIFLSDGRRDDFHNIKNSQHNDRLVAHLRQGLREYNPDVDYLVLIGSPYVQAAVMALIGQRHHKVNLLRWDNRDLIYIPLTLEI
jgi:hypothetical protein